MRFLQKRFVLSAVFLFLLIFFSWMYVKRKSVSPLRYSEPESAVMDVDPYAWLRDWKRPEGPPKVGLQVGHWKNEELPDELSRLIGNTGTSGGGYTEVEVNLEIALIVAKHLEAEGIHVDILPATVPVDYWADVFVAIHADGSTDRSASGFKVAAPRRDFTGKTQSLVTFLELAYEPATLLKKDPNITRNMRGYYAFSWWRYDHAVHPMTTAAIVETGFLTNAADRRIIADKPEVPAKAIAEGILNYLTEHQLL